MKFLLRAFLLFSLILWLEKPAFAQKKKVIGIQKTSCYGACPVYTMDILSNCKVILRSEKFLEIGPGVFKSKLSKNQYEELIDSFRKANYFGLDEIYSSKVSDLPTTYFFFEDNGTAKTIEVYGKWPEALVDVDKQLTDLIAELKWKKVSSLK